ncbi:MAG: DUF1700 domain-containing protein [Lachnospiraceae bacterium]|nr:DUF1700 domain-containing protein [Lachnospiraceae bacterium]
MSKEEFIEKLQRALAGGLNSSQVADNIRYYREYIDSEVRKGRREEEVLAQLGEPRLLAKSIIEANKHAGTSYGSNREYDEEVTAGGQHWDSTEDQPNIKRVMLPGWLVMLIATVIVIVVIGLVTSLLYLFAPVIIVVLIIVLIVKVFQSNSRR